MREHEVAPLMVDSRGLFDFSEVVKYGKLKIQQLARRRLTKVDAILETIENNPELFDYDAVSKVVTPKREILEEYFQPQMEVEDMFTRRDLLGRRLQECRED